MSSLRFGPIPDFSIFPVVVIDPAPDAVDEAIIMDNPVDSQASKIKENRSASIVFLSRDTLRRRFSSIEARPIPKNLENSVVNKMVSYLVFGKKVRLVTFFGNNLNLCIN